MLPSDNSRRLYKCKFIVLVAILNSLFTKLFMAYSAPPPPSVDSRSGFCRETMTFHSLRPPVSLPPDSLPLSAAAYALTLLPSQPTDRPALVDATTGYALLYQEFLPRFRSLAAGIRSSFALPPGDVAFILSPARLEVPVLYFALLSIGVIISPANHASTAAEIARLCSLSRPSLAFATSATAGKLPRGLKYILIDSPDFLALLAADPDEGGELANIRQSDAAAILYSSGTTGLVKGVVLTHRNLIAELAPFIAATASSGVAGAQKAAPGVQMLTVPLFHIYGFLYSLKSVAMGETGVIQTEKFDPRKTLAAIERFRVTHLALAPPALLAIVRLRENSNMEGAEEYDLSSLEVVMCGGAPTGVELIRRFMAMFPRARLQQGYGLTETTSGVFRLAGEECQHIGAVGRLVRNCEAKIVDPVTKAALFPGQQGELLLRGPIIMKGYIGDQEATTAILDSEGWFKTGDLCYIDDDGFLFIIDRLKELIKYKGYQVPPAELEHLLQTHPDIIEAAVIPYSDEEAGQIPAAFVVRKPYSTLNELQVIKFVANQVAPYKRIRCVFFIESIPKNAAGKMLRKDLIQVAIGKLSSKL